MFRGLIIQSGLFKVVKWAFFIYLSIPSIVLKYDNSSQSVYPSLGPPSLLLF
jgi:hypothetical protein